MSYSHEQWKIHQHGIEDDMYGNGVIARPETDEHTTENVENVDDGFTFDADAVVRSAVARHGTVEDRRAMGLPIE